MVVAGSIVGCGEAPPATLRAPAANGLALVSCALGAAKPGGDGTLGLSCTSAAAQGPLTYEVAVVEIIDAKGGDHTLQLEHAGTPQTTQVWADTLPLHLTLTSIAQIGGDGSDAFVNVAVLEAKGTLATPGDTFALTQPYTPWTLTLHSDQPGQVLASYSLSLAPEFNSMSDAQSRVSITAQTYLMPGHDVTLIVPVALTADTLPLVVDDGTTRHAASVSAPGYYVVDGSGLHAGVAALDMGTAATATPDLAAPIDLATAPDLTPSTCGGAGQSPCSDGSCAPGCVYVALSGTCVACGQQDQPTCSDGNCAAGFVLSSLAGDCVACGKQDQPECSDGTCAPGFTYVDLEGACEPSM